ncbi:hypothetical protein RUM8411_02637 [Ruegeria meonggei]|uniref:Uncharacterized protein n=1 Tax=Ruegeria meonggei TaxID=1446476 RepID=A0A1X6ZN88_9RHOB|nr:hypothetical protein RUM8411_02637 [Ruegeria meonggei]
MVVVHDEAPPRSSVGGRLVSYLNQGFSPGNGLVVHQHMGGTIDTGKTLRWSRKMFVILLCQICRCVLVFCSGYEVDRQI